MEAYLIKSVLCLAILMVFYHTLLESEKFHQFKRFYLLASLVFAFTVPFITFTTYIQVELEPITNELLSASNHTITSPAEINDSINWYLILWSVYGFGALVYLVRFVFNLSHIRSAIKNNPVLKSSFYNKVLMQKNIVPHSFFKFIFINKDAFEHALIPDEVIAHEEAHVKQQHSIDIVFIEILQIVFWFNPLLHLVKKAIKLNHEFLADANVIISKTDVISYQNLLINYKNCTNHTALTSPLNYSLTKKRILMLSKTRSKNKWIKLGLVLPLLAGLTFSFSTKDTVVDYVERQPKEKIPLVQANSEPIEIPNEKAKDLTLNTTSTEATSRGSKTEVPLGLPSSGIFASKLQKPQSSKITINDKKLELVVTPSIIVLNDDVVSLNNFTKRLDKITKKWSAADLKDYDLSVSLSNIDNDRREALEAAFRASRLGKANPNKSLIPPAPPRPERPLGSRNDDNERYLERVERYEARLEKMQERVSKRREKAEERKEILEVRREEIMEDREATREERLLAREEMLKDRQLIIEERRAMIEEGHDSDVPMPPLPPTPPEPVNVMDDIVYMAKQNATFYFEGDKITSDKAIDIVKTNKSINVQIIGKDGKTPVVKLSKYPIRFN